MFGDFSRQAIYDEKNNVEQMKERLEELTSFIKYKLTINCRNTKPIGEEIKCVTGFDSREYLWTKADGPPVNYYTYDDVVDCAKRMEEILDELLKDKISPGKITILSPRKRENSSVSLVKKRRIINYIPDEVNNVTFSTIQSFKGLENSVIILTDIDNYENEKLMYVGLSRARNALIIFETKAAGKQRRKLMMEMMKWLMTEKSKI